MKDTRKSVKVVPAVKSALEDIRKQLDVKTESQALAYLEVMYLDIKTQHKRISLADHKRYMREAEEMHNQQSM